MIKHRPLCNVRYEGEICLGFFMLCNNMTVALFQPSDLEMFNTGKLRRRAGAVPSRFIHQPATGKPIVKYTFNHAFPESECKG